MIWFFLIVAAMITGLSLIGPFLTKGDTPPARGKITAGLIGFVIIGLGVYALIGQPELTKVGALTAYEAPPSPSPRGGPSAEDVKAAQAMSPKDRAAMIIAMVDSLAEKLKDNPEDPAAWARLLRARTVLGQDKQKAIDLETVKTLFANRPEVLEQILDAQ